MELGLFDITYHSRIVIKGQALADFIVEGTNLEDPSYQSENGDTEKEGDTPVWKLYVDGASNEHNSSAGIILTTLENHPIHCALRFGFNAANNEAEYEALLAGLCFVLGCACTVPRDIQ